MFATRRRFFRRRLDLVPLAMRGALLGIKLALQVLREAGDDLRREQAAAQPFERTLEAARPGGIRSSRSCAWRPCSASDRRC